MRKAVFLGIFFALSAGTVYGQSGSTLADDQVTASYLASVKPHTLAANSNADGSGVLGRRSSGGELGIDSVAN
jgi:hypothetical protein